MNERDLKIRVVHDAKCYMGTTEPTVLEIRFDLQVLWFTSMFPEQTVLSNTGLTVLCCEKNEMSPEVLAARRLVVGQAGVMPAGVELLLTMDGSMEGRHEQTMILNQ